MKKDRRPERDPILAEVWAIKDRLAARFGHDVECMLRDAQRRQRAGGRKIVSLPTRKPISP